MYHLVVNTNGFICWLVNEESRQNLLQRVPPEYTTVVCHHVTIAFDVPANTPLPAPKIGRVVGEICDRGVQAVVVEIDGDTIRPDGERYHITMSLDEGRFPEEARRLVRRGWFPLLEPIEVALIPKFISKQIPL